MSGFPVMVSQNIFNAWAGNDPSNREIINKLVAPTDFSVSWTPSTRNKKQISVTKSQTQFQILIDDASASPTTLTLGSTRYTCQPTLSLVKIQHANLVPPSSVSPTQELIMTFRIENRQMKQSNPSSPDIILLCRPVILTASSDSSSQDSPFWTAVNNAAFHSRTESALYNPADNFTYDGETLLPMMTYETCIPTRLIGGTNATKEGATRIRVHVATQPLYIPSVTSGTGQCTTVSKFIVPVTRLVDIFGENGYTNVQFATGVSSGSNTYSAVSSQPSDYLTLSLPSSKNIGSWESMDQTSNSVLNMFEYLVPELFLGKTLAEISAMKSLPVAKSAKKAYKCYTIDPTRDIVDDQIMIDPTTGESLQDSMKQRILAESGGDPALAAALAGQAAQNTGILPGDIEAVILIIVSTLGGIALLAHFLYLIRLIYVKDYHNAQIHSIYFGVSLLILIGISAGISADVKKNPHNVPV
jgi:hypothetical protein